MNCHKSHVVSSCSCSVSMEYEHVGWVVSHLCPVIEASVSKGQTMTYNDYTLYHIFVVIVLSNEYKQQILIVVGVSSSVKEGMNIAEDKFRFISGHFVIIAYCMLTSYWFMTP